jgi:DNA-directed RNA polymerase specialized sigma subunit
MATSTRPRTGHLATPLSLEERRYVARMYREHQGLIRLLGRRMCRKYRFVASDDLFSSIDTAFIKTCRAWDPEKGTFSTLLTAFCQGEILHFIRDGNWLIKAPGNVRRLGQLARRLLEQGHNVCEVRARLGLSEEQLRNALVATQAAEHDVRGFDLQESPYATPWDALEASEAMAI